MALTDTAIKNAKPCLKPGKDEGGKLTLVATDNAYKMFDERGLFLIVSPAGGKWWRFRYKLDGKEKLLSLGVYPDIGLKDARDRCDAARKLLAQDLFVNPLEKAIKGAPNCNCHYIGFIYTVLIEIGLRLYAAAPCHLLPVEV